MIYRLSLLNYKKTSCTHLQSLSSTVQTSSPDIEEEDTGKEQLQSTIQSQYQRRTGLHRLKCDGSHVPLLTHSHHRNNNRRTPRSKERSCSKWQLRLVIPSLEIVSSSSVDPVLEENDHGVGSRPVSHTEKERSRICAKCSRPATAAITYTRTPTKVHMKRGILMAQLPRT
jgi:hypothetical protein